MFMMKKKKMDKGGETHSHNHRYNFDDEQAMKGVNKVLPRYDRSTGKLHHGESESNWGGKLKNETRIKKHKEVLEEMKSMPNPKLKGLAEGGKVSMDQSWADQFKKGSGFAKGGEVKGVHTGFTEKQGQSHAGNLLKRSNNEAKNSSKKLLAESLKGRSQDEHERVLHEIRSMPNPKLKGLAQGGMSMDADFAEKFKKGSGFAEGGMASCPTCGHDNKEDVVSKIMAKRKAGSEKPMSLTDDIMNTADMDEENVAAEHKGLHQNGKDGKDYGDEDGDDDFVAKIMKKNKQKKPTFPSK